MQSFYRQTQGSTHNGQEAQAEKEENIQQQIAKCSNWKEISEICWKQEKEEYGEWALALSRNVDFGWRRQKMHLKLGRERGKRRNHSL